MATWPRPSPKASLTRAWSPAARWLPAPPTTTSLRRPPPNLACVRCAMRWKWSTAADVVIIAIKPYQIAAVVKPLADELAKPETRFVVSIAAGWNLKKYRGPVHHRRRRIRRLFGHPYPVHHSEHSDGRGQGRACHRIRQHPDRRRKPKPSKACSGRSASSSAWTPRI